MIKRKQVQGLEELRNIALVSAEQGVDGTVTLTRSDGFSLSFAAGDGVKGDKGDKGSKGDKGPDGLSAYELAVLQGYNDTEENWHSSFKGDKGDAGLPGINGTNGINGKTPVLNETATVKKGVTSAAVLGKDNSFVFTLPDIKQGEKGSTGQRYQITDCTVTYSEDNVFSVNTTWQEYDGTVNVTLPVPQMGEKGLHGIVVNGSSPTLSKVTVDRILASGSTWTCVGGGQKDQNGYSFELSPAATGLQGVIGDDGLPGIAIGNLDITNGNPSIGFSTFNVTDKGVKISFYCDETDKIDLVFDITDNIKFSEVIL